MSEEELAAIRADLAVPLNPTPLHEHLASVYTAHYASHGPAAEHLAVEVDERDLDDWIDQAALNHARGMTLRGQVAALLAAVDRLRLENHDLRAEGVDLRATVRGLVDQLGQWQPAGAPLPAGGKLWSHRPAEEGRG